MMQIARASLPTPLGGCTHSPRHSNAHPARNFGTLRATRLDRDAIHGENPSGMVDLDPDTQRPLSPSSRPDLAPSATSPPRPVTAESAQELLKELINPEKFGSRGEAWVLAQFVILGLVAFPPGGIRSIVDTLGGILLVSGLALVVLGGTALGQFLTPLPQPREDHALVTDGVYDLVRHPMYGGLVMAGTGLALATGDSSRLAMAALLFVVLDQKAAYEEGLLEERYGQQYSEYKRKVRKFVPWLY